MKLKALSVACLSLAAAFLVHAKDPTSTLKAADEKFVKAAAESGMVEVKVSELGAQKASRAEVKALAETMIKDHTALNGELKTLAGNKGAQLSAAIDPTGAATIKDLEQYNGDEFDKQFLKALEAGHEKSVKNFKSASEDSVDGDVKAFASKNLPTIEGHLEHIKRLQK
jgi:putative membrane protein